MTLLTLDAGNSKLRVHLYPLAPEAPVEKTRNERALASASFDADSKAPSELKAFLRSLESSGHDAPRAAALSAVVEKRLEEKIVRAVERALDRGAPLVRETGELLENRTSSPETVGRDRLFTALGGLEFAPKEEVFLVADAGTALTVDLVTRRAKRGEALGCFCGGAIAPGPGLLARALDQGGARLPLVDLEGVEASRTKALGTDTEGALLSGVVHGFRGAATELLERIAVEEKLDAPRILVTGGARTLLLDLPLAPRLGRIVEVPDLIHYGLCRAARHALSAEG